MDYNQPNMHPSVKPVPTARLADTQSVGQFSHLAHPLSMPTSLPFSGLAYPYRIRSEARPFTSRSTSCLSTKGIFCGMVSLSADIAIPIRKPAGRLSCKQP